MLSLKPGVLNRTKSSHIFQAKPKHSRPNTSLNLALNMQGRMPEPGGWLGAFFVSHKEKKLLIEISNTPCGRHDEYGVDHLSLLLQAKASPQTWGNNDKAGGFGREASRRREWDAARRPRTKQTNTASAVKHTGRFRNHVRADGNCGYCPISLPDSMCISLSFHQPCSSKAERWP